MLQLFIGVHKLSSLLLYVIDYFPLIDTFDQGQSPAIVPFDVDVRGITSKGEFVHTQDSPRHAGFNWMFIQHEHALNSLALLWQLFLHSSIICCSLWYVYYYYILLHILQIKHPRAGLKVEYTYL